MTGQRFIEIKSPLSGTFYRAPSPETLSYVEVGQQVKAGDTLCLVEQMKVFTEIIAEQSLIIRKILLQNEDFVAESQVLMEAEAV